MKPLWCRAILWPVIFLLQTGMIQAGMIELSKAVVVVPGHLTGPETKAVDLLINEVAKRTQIRLPCVTVWPREPGPVIAVGPSDCLGEFAGPFANDFATSPEFKLAEGYRLRSKIDQGHPVVLIAGNDSRGVLYGIGRLLRELRMSAGVLALPENLDIASAPKYALRGHQLGYRPKTNSYDAWDVATWEQYLCDLAVFGCNAIELLPPRSDDEADSPHFPLPPMRMMIEMSRLAGEYGLDVWVWYPAMDKDYANPQTFTAALEEWDSVLKQLPRLNAVFVPGGDPGHTPPKDLMALLARQTEQLHRHHPSAQMWISPQGFTQEWKDEFLGILKHDSPDWLTGIVFGPQIRLSLPQLRAAVPAKYPIRHYPDITHTRQCQYAVPDWDAAFALTEGRECINPRPEDEAVIFKALQPYTIGFLTYSEGCNDDVNKTIWSALGWNPDARAIDILREYARYFIGESHAEGFAQGLLALERNWRGPLLANAHVTATLQQFQSLERSASPKELRNWRFQQALFRAYYDAYVRRRLIRETELEDCALERLRQAPLEGALPVMAAAERILDRAVTEPVAQEWRQRLFELGAALFQSIGMQLSVEKYQAIAVDRGASLDTIDFPLNNSPWMKERFGILRQRITESERLKGIQEMTQWENPGPGGFYDDLGAPGRQPHLVSGPGFERDPGLLLSARNGFEEDSVSDEPDEKPAGVRRRSWLDHAESLFDTPLQVRYRDLNPDAKYRIRIVYAGDSPKRKIRLVAERGIEIHPFIVKPFPFKPIEFEIPNQAIREGQLTLSWTREPGQGANGRGCQVSEIWLIKR
jgi:hypothetical protein